METREKPGTAFQERRKEEGQGLTLKDLFWVHG